MTDWTAWAPSTPYTVGIEEEVMLLDRGSWDLTQAADAILPRLSPPLPQHTSTETHRAAIELATGAHATVGAAVAELHGLRLRLAEDLDELGLAAAAAGVHPVATSDRTELSSAQRHQIVHATMREIARREPTFALHVHIGVGDPEAAIRLVNRLRAHLPLLLALSASSPFWRGRATGLASMRTVLFQAFPRTGLPRRFEDYDDWVQTVDPLVRSGAIAEPTFLWWDVRPQPRLGTVETRIMDSQPDSRSTGALCALVQAIASLELEEGWASPQLVRAQETLEENRFLAARDGASAALVDPVAMRRVPVADLLEAVLPALRPHAAALGTAQEIESARDLVAEPEAGRQVRVAASAGLVGLVRDLAARFSR